MLFEDLAVDHDWQFNDKSLNFDDFSVLKLT